MQASSTMYASLSTPCRPPRQSQPLRSGYCDLKISQYMKATSSATSTNEMNLVVSHSLLLWSKVRYCTRYGASLSGSVNGPARAENCS